MGVTLTIENHMAISASARVYGQTWAMPASVNTLEHGQHQAITFCPWAYPIRTTGHRQQSAVVSHGIG